MILTPSTLKHYHVFLASPADVNEERQAVREFFDGYNQSIAQLWGVRFEVVIERFVAPPWRKVQAF